MKKFEQIPDSMHERMRRMVRRTWGRLWITYMILMALCAVLITWKN